MSSVIIPAAGLATRMKPLSRGVSKAMIPVNGRPIISYILDHLIKNNPLCEIVIVENEIGDISEFIHRVYSKYNIKTVIQEEKNGPLHAIHLGWKELRDKENPITVWLGDTICLDDFDYSQDFLAVNEVPDTHRWCLIDEAGNLYDKVETAVPTNLALIGVYNFSSRKNFNDAIELGMSEPKYKNEHQIASLLNNYKKLQGKPMSLFKTQHWYDCGELNTFYESKAKLLKNTARSFNQLDVDIFYNLITKSSTDEDRKKKIEDEKHWYKSLNDLQSRFVPTTIDIEEFGKLIMSLEPGTPLNEIISYDNLHPEIWFNIIQKILKIHHTVFYNSNHEDDIYEIKKICFEFYVIKNLKRIETHCSNYKNYNVVKRFIEETGFLLCKAPEKHWSKVIHGDSHLGNILYDPQSGSIKFVDPRGSFGGGTSTSGDMRYDMAKLLQDFYCGYSMIMSDRYEYVNENIQINWVKDSEKMESYLVRLLEQHGYDVDLLKRLAIVLLITAIPFHKDRPVRQQAFWNRGVDLINQLRNDT